MSEKLVIVVDDKTTHNGTVITGNPSFEISNKLAACLGDKVMCPQHGETEITEGYTPLTLHPSRTLAYHGCKTSCGATLIGGGQGIVFVDVDDQKLENSQNNFTNIIVLFEPSAKKSDITSYSLNILTDVLKKANLKKATISSTARDSFNQARVMYANLVGDGPSQGVGRQRKLYGSKPGSHIINVFVACKKMGTPREETIMEMKKMIDNIGPENVSKHACNPKIYNVFDVAPSSIENKIEFEHAALSDPRITRFLTPSQGDPSYHFEIKQPLS